MWVRLSFDFRSNGQIFERLTYGTFIMKFQTISFIGEICSKLYAYTKANKTEPKGMGLCCFVLKHCTNLHNLEENLEIKKNKALPYYLLSVFFS